MTFSRGAGLFSYNEAKASKRDFVPFPEQRAKVKCYGTVAIRKIGPGWVFDG